MSNASVVSNVSNDKDMLTSQGGLESMSIEELENNNNHNCSSSMFRSDGREARVLKNSSANLTVI